MKQREINNDNLVLYNKLYNIDKYGHKKHLKQMKPIFQYTKQAMAGNKKHEIIRVAQENLYMLKRLNERTSFYNVEKWNKDYEASQYYKKNHCLYSPIDFNKTQRYGGFNTGALSVGNKTATTRKKFFSKTHYAGMGTDDSSMKRGFATSNRKRKKFEDFNYRDLELDLKNKKEEPEKNKEEQQFKKISEVGNEEQENQETNKADNNDKKNGEVEKNNEAKKEEEKKEEGNEEQREQQKNMRDDKVDNEEQKVNENNNK